MQKEIKIEITLLKKFFNKKCSKQEQEIVINWFVDAAYEQKLSFILKRHWDEIEYNSDDLDEATEKVLNKIHHQINLEKFDEQQNTPWLKKASFYYSKIAAVLLIPIFIYTLHSVLNKDTINNNLIELQNQTEAYAKIVSPLGARTHFTLPDGSSGWLNSGSTLEFPVIFTGKQRNLKLTGEAWFDVIKNPEIPFVVDAAGIDVIALGTKFNVLAYPDDNFVDITLESGKVIVKRKVLFKNKLIAELNPGDKVKILKDDFNPKKDSKVETKNFTSWRKGTLIIRKEKMKEVVKRLERWYNVTIKIEDKEIEEYVYRATFQDETIDEILNYLKLTSPIDYKIKARKTNVEGTLEKKEITLFINN